ncbi:sugar ABC transporter permease [Clostridia bacterium]|nr:sugar ABC transporter permease [Clostridia bacterium]
MKRIASAVVCLVLLAAIMLTGSAALGEGKPKLTVWTGLGSKVSEVYTTWNDIACWQYIQEKFNTEIEFIHPAVGSEAESFSLMLASGTLPDVINGGWGTFQGAGANKAIADGIIIPLNNLLATDAPDFTTLLEEHPDWKYQMSTDEGTIAYFPHIYETQFACTFEGFQIRQDWLSALGLDMPATIEEWHDVLTAFRDGDPNGNGEKDELAFVPSPNHNQIRSWRIPFGLNPYSEGFYLNPERQVMHTYLSDEYANYLRTMAAWYAEGLIDPEYITNDRNMLTAKMTDNLAGATYAGYGMGFLGNWTNAMKSVGDESFFLVGAPYPVGPDGIVRNKSGFTVGTGGFAISTDCANPNLAVQILNYVFSEEGGLIYNFGPGSDVYTLVDGKPVYKSSAELIGGSGLPVDSVLLKAGGMACNGSLGIEPDAYQRMVVSTFEGQSIAAVNYNIGDSSYLIPPISQTAEESDELSEIVIEITTLMDEYETKVIMGLESIDKLPDMLKTLEGMNIQRAIELKQLAVDRYFAR